MWSGTTNHLEWLARILNDKQVQVSLSPCWTGHIIFRMEAMFQAISHVLFPDDPAPKPLPTEDLQEQIARWREDRAFAKEVNAWHRKLAPRFRAQIRQDIYRGIEAKVWPSVCQAVRPIPLTRRDLVDAFEDCLAPLPFGDLSMVDQFYDNASKIPIHLASTCRDRGSPRFSVAVVPSDFKLGDCPHPLWAGRSAVIDFHSVDTTERWKQRSDGTSIESTRKMFCFVAARMTPGAANAAKREAQRVLQATLALCNSLDNPLADEHSDSRLPHLTLDSLQRHHKMLGKWLDAFYTTEASAKTLDGQLRTAIHLLVEADHQTNDAVALSLGCAALEALASRRDNDNTITSALAENIATLLEPDPNERLAAQRVVKQLYRLRSSTLHGSSSAASPADRRRVRALAAHLLRAIVEWRDFGKRVGGSKRSDSFFEELEAARAAGRVFFAATDSPIRRLWVR